MAHNEDEFTNFVEFEAEDGSVIELAIIKYFEYEGEMYAILADPDVFFEEPDGDTDVEVAVLRIIETDEGHSFEDPDEALVPELQQIVMRILAEDDDCDCGHDHEDGECCCGHHHHDEN